MGFHHNVVSVTGWLACSVLLLSACSSGGGGDDSSGGSAEPLPASVLVNKVPDQTVYGLGEPVTVTTLVLDADGDPIANASVDLTSDPPAAQQVDANQFVYLADGTYTITATVQGDTQSGLAVTSSVTIMVDGHGPTIACANPIDGAILDQAPGPVTLTGSVDDVNGVGTLSVNGGAVQVDPTGSFATPIDAAWGINFVDLAAVDGVGREARRTCAFLLSETWAPDTDILPSTISLKARQAAFDDNNRADAIDSADDVLYAVLNSNGLRNDLHTALLANNPLKPDACDSSVLGVCVLRSRVRYIESQINGPNTAALSLVTGGLSNASTVNNIRIRIRVDGDVGPIPYDTTGWVTFNSATINAIFDTTLAQGQPKVSTRPGSVNVSVGSISTDFSGLDGGIINIVVGLFNGTVRNLVAGLVRDFTTNNFSSVLDGIVGALDVRNLPNTFDVPRLDGASPVTVTFATNFSTLNTSTTRMLASMGTQFQTAPAHARPTLGAPIPSGARLLDVSTSGTIAIALHMGLIDQALHALWRGGYFDATLSGGALNGLVPSGVTLDLSAALPPAASLRDDGRIEIALGAFNVHIVDPVLLVDPVDAVLGGRVSCALDLDVDAFLLQNCTVDELHVSMGNSLLDQQIRSDLEQLLNDVLDNILSTVVTNALPAVPLPGFPLSASLGVYGIPTGELGMVNPSLTIQGQHGVLEGTFGIR